MHLVYGSGANAHKTYKPTASETCALHGVAAVLPEEDDGVAPPPPKGSPSLWALPCFTQQSPLAREMVGTFMLPTRPGTLLHTAYIGGSEGAANNTNSSFIPGVTRTTTQHIHVVCAALKSLMCIGSSSLRETAQLKPQYHRRVTTTAVVLVPLLSAASVAVRVYVASI